MNIDQIVGSMTNEQTREMALSCMIELTDEQQWDLIKELALQDKIWAGELIAQLEDL